MQGRLRVEPICRVLTEHGCPIAPSTYYDNVSRRPSRRALRDAEIIALIEAEGHDVARCTIEPLMATNGWAGTTRGKGVRTTIPDAQADRPADLVARDFTATAPISSSTPSTLALWRRRSDGIAEFAGLVHHTDAGSQYTSFAFTQRLIDAGVDPSVGSLGDT